jgi:hypothetical protein
MRNRSVPVIFGSPLVVNAVEMFMVPVMVSVEMLVVELEFIVEVW